MYYFVTIWYVTLAFYYLQPFCFLYSINRGECEAFSMKCIFHTIDLFILSNMWKFTYFIM